jgi:hypothetical protein
LYFFTIWRPLKPLRAGFLKPTSNDMLFCSTEVVKNNEIEAIAQTNFEKMDGV